MNIRYDGKVIIVTGGTRGIGLATSRHFAQLGSKVYATYVKSEEAAHKIAEHAQAEGLFIRMLKADIKNAIESESVVKAILSEQPQIDVLVNNAGITADKLVLQMENEDFESVLQTNICGVFYLVKQVLPLMISKRSGNIINISSMAATKPNKGQANYSASKGAVESFTKALAHEVAGRNIRVNAIAPGMIETDMSQDIREMAGDQILPRIPLKRFGKADDIANAAVFLASDFATYITGQVWHVDGGFY